MILNGLRIYQQSWRSMGIRPNASATAMQSDRGGISAAPSCLASCRAQNTVDLQIL